MVHSLDFRYKLRTFSIIPIVFIAQINLLFGFQCFINFMFYLIMLMIKYLITYPYHKPRKLKIIQVFVFLITINSFFIIPFFNFISFFHFVYFISYWHFFTLIKYRSHSLNFMCIFKTTEVVTFFFIIQSTPLYYFSVTFLNFLRSLLFIILNWNHILLFYVH